MEYYLSTHNKIGVSVSGGSDSNIIVHIIATYFRHHLDKIVFYWCNTGLEFAATRRHLKFMEERYNIKIQEIRGMPIPLAIKRFGVPILNKEFSERIGRARNGSTIARKKLFLDRKDSRWGTNEYAQDLAAFLLEHTEQPISSMCCYYSKKKPSHAFAKDQGFDLDITGERKSEGGVRASKHRSCFEGNRKNKADKYMPLWFWDDATKRYYKEHEGIRYSDCYEIWGFKRTGCVGCPFGSRIGIELQTIKQFEPKMYKACVNIFGESYRLMDEFLNRKYKIFPEEEQLSLFDWSESNE